MKTQESMLTRALEIEASQPVEAAQLFSRVLMLAPANITAHNALERMQAQQCYKYGKKQLLH